MTRLPDFVVLGQGKAGTSLIYRSLQAMPDIGLSTPKELHFFNVNYDNGRDWYARHFADIPPDIATVGEVSPAYLKAQAIERLRDTLGPDVKLIYVLRKPVEQNYARYLQNICARQEAKRFYLHIKHMPGQLARLEEALATAMDGFGEANILPLIFETDIAAPGAPFVAKIRAFLGLPEAEAVGPAGPVNKSVMPRYLYSGEHGYRITAADYQPFWIPPRRLVFCAQDRNSQVWRDPSAEDVASALMRQSMWSPEVSKAEYAHWQEAHVIPAAERLSQRFGLDLGHWSDPPRRLAYAPAPPPPQFLAKEARP